MDAADPSETLTTTHNKYTPCHKPEDHSQKAWCVDIIQIT